MTTTLFEGGRVLTLDADGNDYQDGCVLVRDDRIDYVGPRDGLPAGPVDRTLDVGGKLVMPGLVNGHTHLSMVFGRTLGPEKRLMQWLDQQLPIIEAFDEEAMYVAQLLGCLENLKNGNTTLVENLVAPHPPGYTPEHAVLQAMRDAGVRATLAPGFLGRNFRPSYTESLDLQARRIIDLTHDWHGADNDRLRLATGPLLPWCMDEAMFRQTRALADDLGITLHMHGAETKEFHALIARHFGRDIRQVELLAETGCLGPDVQLAAVYDISPDEVRLLAESDTRVLLDPPTRLFWGTGFPPIHPFLEAGVTCGLATNGPAANCGQDLFESMKYACATAKTAKGDPDALDAARALRMATSEGALAIGREGQVGSLAPGLKADIITLDLHQPHLAPTLDVRAALVYSAGGTDVRDVMVDGRLLIENRRALFLDESALLEQAGRLARRCAREAGIALPG
ncbi:amidohydrolase family protein [Alloalcanivorax marinus]|uniref:amidohydrolase family protein n=1 Tax=Alloalcanivorax marinus TaxID=1177169 RepID=UPI0021D3D59C|nr:amidohydrolase family protein [Alloalcanivorax marinus]MCU5786523.1 amidohydrolase [Alloalcanivorax marinus]